MSEGFNITITVPSGNPDKLRIIQKTNRLSTALVFNRDELADVIHHKKEVSYTGIYMLINSNTNALPEIYIGEAESVKERLTKHNTDPQKEFWEWAVLFINRDNSLHKGHILHIEASLIERAELNKRCRLNNDKMMSKPTLTEAVLIEAEDFLQDIYHTLPLLGISAFEPTPHSDIPNPNIGEPTSQGAFLPVPLLLTTKGISAQGFSSNGKLIVKKGSELVSDTTPTTPNGILSLRSTLVENGVIDKSTEPWLLTQDYTFDSPWAAAATVMGRNANGRTEWRTSDGKKTLKQLQEENISEPLKR